MNEIIPSEWGLSLREFREWVANTKSEVKLFRHNDRYPVDRAESFYFTKQEDESAFKLTFIEKRNRDSAFYYCPYIPILKK